MILACRELFLVGTREVGMTDGERAWHEQPFVVMGMATASDWLQQCGAHGLDVQMCEQELRDAGTVNFYEVSVD